MKLYLFILFLFPFFTQALEVIARVDRNNLVLNEAFVFTIIIQSDKGEKIKHLEIPDLSSLNDFHLLGQWSERESSFQIINGRTSNTNRFLKNYRFQPKTMGTLRIEAFTIRVNKKTFITNPVFITVTKKSNAPPQPLQNNPFTLPSPFYSPKSLFNLFDQPFLKDKQSTNTVKVKLNVNKISVYKGEILRADWFILQSSGSIHYELHKSPSLKGFWKEELKNKIQHNTGTQIIDNVLYKKSLLNRLWLFPLKTGTLAIDPYSIIIHNIFSFRSQNKIESSLNQKITIKALPSEGLENFFTGAVGSFKLTVSLKEKTTLVNKPISYKIIFQGSGHPRFIQLPKLNFPSSIQSYPPTEKSHFSDLGIGKKEFEILIIPKQEGLLKIPSFKFNTFDPIKGNYVVHKTPSFSLNVKKGISTEEDIGHTFFEEKKKQKKEKPFFQSLNIPYWPQFINHKNLNKFWLGLFVFFLFILTFSYITNFFLKKEDSFNKKINQRLKSINELLNKKNWRKACIQMIRLNYFVLYESQKKSSSSDWRQIVHNLPPSLNKKYALQFENLFKGLENLSFSQASFSEKEALNKAQILFQQTKTLISSFLSNR